MAAANTPAVLVVDDEAALRESLAFAFQREGFQVTTAADGTAALEQARRASPDVVVLDLMLPGLDGLAVCRELRQLIDVPVVMLTARDQVADRLRGFETGADDYVTKPFSTRELIARTRAVLRRAERGRALLREDRALLARMEELSARLTPSATAPRPPVTRTSLAAVPAPVTIADGLRLDPARETAVLDGRHLALASHEYRVLDQLARNAGRVVTRTELMHAGWGAATDEHRVLLDATIRVLRDKLEIDPMHPTRILTVPGIGYTYG